jgi:ADP-heptose:LPS heptosyltransferase
MLKKNYKAHLLKFFTKKKAVDFDLKDSKCVLFFRYDRIGDMVITTPVFREFKRAYPHTRLIVLASKVNKCVLENNPYVDELIVNYKNNILVDFFSLWMLRRRKIDVCVEFDHSVIPHAIIRLKIINPKKIISVSKDGRYGVSAQKLSIYDYYTEKPKNTHFRDIWLATLLPFGINSQSREYDIFCNKLQINTALTFLEKYSNKLLIGVNIEGAVTGKKINFNELNQICEGLYSLSNNIQIIILCNPDKRINVQRDISKMGLEFVTLSYRTKSIIDAAAIIKNLNFVITPDTSITHIASTFNIPVITIHENNFESYQLFAPTSDINKTVFSKSSNSLQDFSVVSLLDAAKELIEIEEDISNNF